MRPSRVRHREIAGVLCVLLVMQSTLGLPVGAAGESAGAWQAGEADSAGVVPPLPIYRHVTDEAGLSAFLHAGFLGNFTGGEPRPQSIEISGPGACWLDHDKDGWMDLYLVNPLSLTFPEMNTERDPHSMLFRNNGDGTFTDWTEAANARTVGHLQGCVAADYTNNGYPDLYVTGWNGSFLLRNDGGVFTDVTAVAGVRDDDCGAFRCWSSSAVFMDADRDGCLDLFVAHFTEWDIDDPPPYNGPGDGQRNRFYRNQCDGTFSDHTAAAGLQGEKSNSWSAVSADLNNDGWVDLYVSNDRNENDVYLNNGDGTFTRRTMSAANDPGSGMGTAIADFDKSGVLDIITTNYISQSNGIFQAFGNDYLNIGGNEPFDDAFSLSGWATHWFDLDNDGLLDLMVFNGNTEEIGITAAQPILAYRNLGGAAFESLRDAIGEDVTAHFTARGGAWADYDNDGDIDFLLGEAGQAPTHLFRADGVGNRFLSVDLESRTPGVNRDAIGARVTVTAPGLEAQMQEKSAGTAFLSSSDPRLHFGLGSADAADLEIRWPDGSVETHTGVRADTFVHITQGGLLETVRGLPLVTLDGPPGEVRRLDPVGFVAHAAPMPGRSIVSYEWDFGDGTKREGGTMETHAFRDVGYNTVRVTAIDSTGARRTQWTQVLVWDDLEATVIPAAEVFAAGVAPHGVVRVAFPDGTGVRDAEVTLVITRTTGINVMDQLIGGLPFFMHQVLGWVPVEITGRTDADGVLAFNVPHNVLQPTPLLPLPPATHPGTYTAEATGGARGSVFEPATATYNVVLPPV